MIDELMSRKQRRDVAAYLAGKHQPIMAADDEETESQTLTFKIQHHAALLVSALEAVLDEMTSDASGLEYLIAGEALGRAHILVDLASLLPPVV